jgi:MscS family membrane protein
LCWIQGGFIFIAMNEFLQTVFLDNNVQDYLIVAGVILVAYLLKRINGRYVSRIFFYLMKQLGKDIDREPYMRLVLVPMENFFFFLISYIALVNLKFPSLFLVKFLKTDTSKVADMLGTTIVILAFFRMLLRGIDYVALVMEKKANITPDQTDNQLVVFFKDFLKVLLVIIGFLSLLKFAFNQNISQILAGLSIVGAAIALAARESLENLIASFVIFFDKPFSMGDTLKVNNISGTVERIGLRSTRIRTADKTYVTMPNKQMVDSIVDNLSLRTQRRGELKLELDLDTPSEKIQQALTGIGKLLEHSLIMSKTVWLTDITADAYLLQCEYFTRDIELGQFNLFKQDFNLKVIQLLESLDIELAGSAKRTEVTLRNEK